MGIGRRMSISKRSLLAGAATLALACACAAPAFAQGSVGGGIFTQSGNGQSSTGAGVLLSSSDPVPILPATVGITGFLPLARGGGYAVTVDGKFSFVNNAIGVGFGVGQFGGAHAGGTATVFVDHKIAPLTSIELRAYRTLGAQGATAGFAGLIFSL